MTQGAYQKVIQTVNGNSFSLEELRQIAVSKQKPDNSYFILYETPREEYIKLTLQESDVLGTTAEVLTSETFYKVLLQDNVELN